MLSSRAPAHPPPQDGLGSQRHISSTKLFTSGIFVTVMKMLTKAGSEHRMQEIGSLGLQETWERESRAWVIATAFVFVIKVRKKNEGSQS